MKIWQDSMGAASARVLAALCALASCGAMAQAPAPAARIHAERFYNQVCARCHEAGIGPVLKGRGLPEATFVVIARTGLNGMPAFRVSDIDDATLKELAAYLAATPPKSPAGEAR